MLDTRSRTLLATLLAMVCLFGSIPANALTLDANVLGIFESLDTNMGVFVDPVVGATIDPDGDMATAPLAAGQFILIGIEVSNLAAEAITAMFTTLIVQGDQISGSLGARLPPTMLKGPGPSGQSLVNINSGDIKSSQPGGFGHPGDVWIQAPSYALQTGANGTGPDTLEILFVVGSAVAIGDFVTFEMGFTAGDSISGASSITFNSAAIQVIPQPGTALLMGLGLIGLSASRQAS